MVAVLCEKIAPGMVGPRSGARTQDNIDRRQLLSAFYDAHYRETVFHDAPDEEKNKMCTTKIHQVLYYIYDDIVKEYETNIRTHYVDHVSRFVDCVYDKKKNMEILKTNHSKKLFHGFLKDMKKYLLHRQGPRPTTLPRGRGLGCLLGLGLTDIGNNNDIRPVGDNFHDLNNQPQTYLPSMIYMMRKVDEKGMKMLNVFPLRTDMIPKHIRLDNEAIVNLLWKKKHGPKYKRKTAAMAPSNWAHLFKTGKRCFKPRNDPNSNEDRPCFRHMIETNGISSSIIFSKKVMVNNSSKEKYVTDVGPADLQEKTLVAIDPNVRDMCYGSARTQETLNPIAIFLMMVIMIIKTMESLEIEGGGADVQRAIMMVMMVIIASRRRAMHKADSFMHFRYTQQQRLFETGTKRHNEQRKKLKKKEIDGKTVQEWEEYLSTCNHKTLHIDSFKEYLKKKNEVNSKLLPFYGQEIFRKHQWWATINRQRSEQNMLNRFKKKYGDPTQVVIGFGNWCPYRNPRHQPPFMRKGLRKLFQDAGYLVVLVDEFRTSAQCYHCREGKCETFLKCKNPRPWKSDETIVRHGLVRCTKCNRLWNRDNNSSLNILRIMECHRAGHQRPAYLRRSQRLRREEEEEAAGGMTAAIWFSLVSLEFTIGLG